jgi:large subunit ribosomal protein L25
MIEGIVRESTEKKATKKLRQDGYLIANIYGIGMENINAAFKANEFVRFMKAKDTLAFTVKVGGKEVKVVAQDYQSNPLTPDLLHVDLRAVENDKLAKFLVPVKTTGSAKGLKNKGVFQLNKKRLAVVCTPANLPNSFVLDVNELDTGDSILIRDMTAPEGVEFCDSGRVSVAGVIKAK